MAITRKPYAGGPIPNGWEKIPGMSRFIRPIAVAPEDVQAPAEAKDDETMHIVKVVSLPGPTGKDGIDGKDGKDGKDGVDGKDGRDGIDGINGVDGKHGKDGKAGPKGLDGKDGKDGKDGEDARGIKKIVSHGSDMEIELTDGSKSRHKLATGGGSSFGGSSPSLGTMAKQDANSVAITGGAISGTSITVADNVFTLQDNLDPTKQAQFQLSGLLTGTTYVYTLPTSNGGASTLVDLNSNQTINASKTFSGTANIFGSSSNTSAVSVATGATVSGATKTVNVGTGGLSGSATAITVGSANGSTTTMLGSTVIGGAAGNQSLQVNNITNAVNYTQITGAATGAAPAILAAGSDTDVGLFFAMKGWNSIKFNSTTGGQLFQIGQLTSATANYFQALGNATGNAPIFSSQGSDTNIGFSLQTKGTGGFNFTAGGGTQAVVSNTASAVNYLQLTGAATGAAPTISAQGSDTNIPLVLTGKGTGVVALGGSAVANAAFIATPVTSAVNWLQGSGNVSLANPFLSSQGTDSNIGLGIISKGTGAIILRTGGGVQAQVLYAASTVNYLGLTGAATTAAPELSAQGSDTNINLKLTPKGTGVLQFGTYTATVLSPTGFITITDAGGTSRRLLVG